MLETTDLNIDIDLTPSEITFHDIITLRGRGGLIFLTIEESSTF